jgi:hypothetical protein
MDSGHGVDVLCLDFKKAFDSVPHKRLLPKKRKLGIENQCCGWIQNFLSNRSQKVRAKDHLSSGSAVESGVPRGVPQGSVIGLTLFVIYINDLPDRVKSSILLFADDVKLHSLIKKRNDSVLLQED